MTDKQLTEVLNLFDCLVEELRFGRVDDNNYNITLLVFTHPNYWFSERSNQFVVFEINYN